MYVLVSTRHVELQWWQFICEYKARVQTCIACAGANQLEAGQAGTLALKVLADAAVVIYK